MNHPLAAVMRSTLLTMHFVSAQALQYYVFRTETGSNDTSRMVHCNIPNPLLVGGGMMSNLVGFPPKLCGHNIMS